MFRPHFNFLKVKKTCVFINIYTQIKMASPYKWPPLVSATHAASWRLPPSLLAGSVSMSTPMTSSILPVCTCVLIKVHFS